jgi:type VI protein secretion system component VasK
MQKRASNFDRATQLANVTRALAKRDITMAHWILIGIILVVACSFIYWWKCARPRKLAQHQGDDEEDPKKKSRLGQLLKVLI